MDADIPCIPIPAGRDAFRASASIDLAVAAPPAKIYRWLISVAMAMDAVVLVLGS